MGSAGKVREAVRLKQYRRVCEGCGETFRPYKDVFTCVTCLRARYNEVWERRVVIPTGEKGGYVRELLEGACKTAWFLLVFTLGSGQAYQAQAQEKQFEGEATYYGVEACAFNPSPSCPTASGKSLYKIIKEDVPYAATWKYPMGSRIEVCREDDPKRCVYSTVYDRGPSKRFRPERIVDLREREWRALVKPSESNLRVVMRRVV